MSVVLSCNRVEHEFTSAHGALEAVNLTKETQFFLLGTKIFPKC